jgi:hypothetical protein
MIRKALANSAGVFLLFTSVFFGLEISFSQAANAAACAPVSTTAGSKQVHSFKTVGQCDWTVPAGVTSVDYLIVAGGGGGASGGGGAGGLLQVNNYSVTANTTISITVGGGGAGGTGQSVGSNGSNSIFNGVTTIGGGGGAAGGGNAGNGGSGGGGRYDAVGTTFGTGTSGQGKNGGSSGFGGYGAGGGGGGAGAVGGNSVVQSLGGAGGDGLPETITGTSVYYAGGGGGGVNANSDTYLTNGGGTGGQGGGGTGSSYGRTGGVQGANTNATNGTANTGGGGGGTDPEDINAGAGGSGIVIIAYLFNASTTATLSAVNGLQSSKKLSATQIRVTVTGVDGIVRFMQNGRPMAGCIRVQTISLVATCSWRPITQGQVFLTAYFTPTSGSYNSSTAAPFAYTIGKRTTAR